MKLVKESLSDHLKGPSKEEVHNKLKEIIRDETDGEVDIEFSSFQELTEKLLLKFTSARWSTYPETIEDVDVGTFVSGIPTGLISILEDIPFVGYLTDDQAYNLQNKNIFPSFKGKIKEFGVGHMNYEHGALDLDGDLFFTLDDKGYISKAMFLQY